MKTMVHLFGIAAVLDCGRGTVGRALRGDGS